MTQFSCTIFVPGIQVLKIGPALEGYWCGDILIQRLHIRQSGTTSWVTMMNSDETSQGERTLATLECDLLKAEEAFAEANTRLKRAESDRRNALETINKHQAEIDEVITALRLRSVTGSNWSRAASKAENALILHPVAKTKDAKNPNEAELASEVTEETVASYIKSVTDDARTKHNDPSLKVLSGNRGRGDFTPSK